MKSVIYEITCIPDVTLTKNRIGSTGGLNGIIALHNSFLRIWNRKGLISDISLHLFYEYIPSINQNNGHIKCFIMLMSQNEIEEDSIRLFESHPLIKKYTMKRVDSLSCMEMTEYSKCSILVKNEVFTQDENDGLSRIHYTIPEWKIDDTARLYEMFTVMSAIKKPVMYRADLYPIDYSVKLRDSIQAMKASFDKSNDKSSFFSRDRAMDRVISSYENIAENIEKSPHYIMNIFCFAKKEDDSKIILDAAGADAISEGSYKVVTFDGKYNALSLLTEDNISNNDSLIDNKSGIVHIIQQNNPGWKVCRNIAKDYKLNYLPVLFTLEEAETFFRLPIVDDGESINMRMDSDFVPIGNQEFIPIGNDNKGNCLKYPIELLNKHAFICGVPGSGKTYTMLHLVTELHKNKIPFLIMEPAKKEYRAIYNYGDEMMDIKLFSPHINSCFQLQVNIMEFPKGITLCEHINVLMNVFSSTFELGDAVYNLLDQSICLAYEKYDWNDYDVNDGSKEYPRLSDVRDIFEYLVENTSYNSNFKGDLKSFLTVRLDGLMRRDAGEVFDAKWSTLKPEDWISESCIIEMEDMGDRNRNFLTLLLCNYIREELKVLKQKNINPDSKFPNHAIFIEEAHNIISNTANQSSESVNPKISATKFIVDMLAEVRALRESIIIADQLPSSMAQEIMKNTGLKITLRMTSQDERQYVGGAMSASPLQVDNLSRYEKGKALIFFESLEKPLEVQICKWGGNDTPPDDEKLARKMVESSISDYKKRMEILIEHLEKSGNQYMERENYLYKQAEEITKIIEKESKEYGNIEDDQITFKGNKIKLHIKERNKLNDEIVECKKELDKIAINIKRTKCLIYNK